MTIVGDSASSTIINAQQLGRIFNITTGSNVSISNLTLENGSFSDMVVQSTMQVH